MTTPAKVRAPGLRPSAAENARRAERVLRIAADLFDVRAAALVVADAGTLRVEIAWARAEWCEGEALDAARHLRDVLTAAEAVTPTSVLEAITPDRGFRASAPIPPAAGRPFGAVCLVDPERRALLSRLQRRLFAEFGTLLLQALDPEARAETSDRSGEARGRAA